MSDNIKVKATPIQRNNHDVAIELLQMYNTQFGFESKEELLSLYSEFYATAKLLDYSDKAGLKGKAPNF